MGLIACPDCQSEISSEAPACPKCGRPTKAVQEPEIIKSRPESTPLENWGCKYPLILIVIVLVAVLLFFLL